MPILVSAGLGEEEFEKLKNGTGSSLMMDLEAARIPQFAAANTKVNTNPVRIDFKDVGYSILVGRGKNAKEKSILKGLSGQLLPGTMTAIMGPTGSGILTYS